MKSLLLLKNKKGVGALVGTAIVFGVLIVSVILTLYIVNTVESSMINSGFNSSSTWWTPYQNFVNNIKPSFTLLGVAALVVVVSFILAILMKLGGR